MRVLLVAHQYWPMPGSATQRLSALTRILIDSGANVHVITTRPPAGYNADRIGPNGEHISYGTDVESNGAGLRRLTTLAKFAWTVEQQARALRYDVVVSDPPPTAAWSARRAAARLGVPFIYYYADTWGGVTADSESRLAQLAHPAVKRVEDNLLQSAGHVVAVTADLQHLAQDAGASSVDLVENGVSVQDFSHLGPTWRPAGSTSPFFLYAGNAGLVHGAEVFALASEQLWREGARFDTVFMGHGADMARLREVKERWPKRLHIVTSQPPETVAAAFRGSIGALSSLRPYASYRDARPIKTITGLAAGSPAVYAGEGRFADLLSSQNLGFVEKWSVSGARSAMVRAMEMYLADPDAFEQLRVRCATYARRNLDNQIGAKRVADFIIKLAGGVS